MWKVIRLDAGDGQRSGRADAGAAGAGGAGGAVVVDVVDSDHGGHHYRRRGESVAAGGDIAGQGAAFLGREGPRV